MMKHEQNGQTKLIEQARTLLSPYLDDEVTPVERELVETMLAQSPELQLELESLRATVNLIQNLPRAPAPRPFTLTRADVGLPSVEEKTFSWWAWLKPAMGSVAIVTAVLIAAAYLLRVGALLTDREEALSIARAPALERTAEQVAEAPAAAQLAEAPAEVETAKEAAAEETVEVEKLVEAEAEIEQKVQLADSEETAAPDARVESGAAAAAEVAGPPESLPTSSPALETFVQSEAAEEPAAADADRAGVPAQPFAPESAQEAALTPTMAAPALLPVTPPATPTPSPAATSPLPTATSPKSAALERGSDQPFDLGTTATSLATATPPPTVLAQANQAVQTPAAQKLADDAAPEATRSPSSETVGRSDRLITFLPVGLIILIVAGVLLLALFWRFSRRQ